MELEFEWDLTKAETNFRKHGIRFEEAALVFDDPFHLSLQDRFENGEYRWQTIRFEDGTEVIRIISARKAERNERKRYEHG